MHINNQIDRSYLSMIKQNKENNKNLDKKQNLEKMINKIIAPKKNTSSYESNS